MAKEKFAPAELDDEQLRSKLQSRDREYQQMKFDHAAKGIANPMELRDLRRNIARIHTETRKREMASMTPEQLETRSKNSRAPSSPEINSIFKQEQFTSS